MLEDNFIPVMGTVFILGLVGCKLSEYSFFEKIRKWYRWQAYVDKTIEELGWEYTLCDLEKNAFLQTLTIQKAEAYRAKITTILDNRLQGENNYHYGSTQRLKAIRSRLTALLSTP